MSVFFRPERSPTSTITTILRLLKKTIITGISNKSAFGYYQDDSSKNYGFVYDGSKYTDIRYPGEETSTTVEGILDKNVYGTYKKDGSSYRSFYYDGSKYFDFNVPSPGAKSTLVSGVSGTKLYGSYIDNKNAGYAFVYDGSTYKTLNMPTSASSVSVQGLSGNLLVGSYKGGSSGNQNFVCDIFSGTYTMVNVPGGNSTAIAGIKDNTVFGNYNDSDGKSHGFLYDVVAKTYTKLIYPTQTVYMDVTGIAGNKVYGSFRFDQDEWEDSDGNKINRSYVYDLSTRKFTEVSTPNGMRPHVVGAQDDLVFGYYEAVPGGSGSGSGSGLSGGGGFVANGLGPAGVPEPGNVAVVMAAAATGAWFLRNRRRKSRPQNA